MNMTYANICFIAAIICFVFDGLGFGSDYHLLSWGSAFFTAGFLTWEIKFLKHQKQREEEEDKKRLKSKNASKTENE